MHPHVKEQLLRRTTSEPIVGLTGRDCVAAAERLERVLARLGVRRGGGTDIEIMVGRLKAIGQKHPGLLWDAPLTERERVHGRRIALVASWAKTLEGLEGALTNGRVAQKPSRQLAYLRKQIDVLETRRSPAQDSFLELEVGVALAEAGLIVRFQEPDIHVAGVNGSRDVYIAVKRPATIAGVDNAMKDARHQAQAHPEWPTVFLICFDAPLGRWRQDGTPGLLWSRTHDELHAGLAQRFIGAVEQSEYLVDRRDDPLVIGTIWFVRMMGAVVPENGSGTKPILSRVMFATATLHLGCGDPDARETLMGLLYSLRQGAVA